MSSPASGASTNFHDEQPKPTRRWSRDKIKDTDQEKLKARARRFQGSTGSTKPSYGFVSRGSESRLQNSDQAQREFFDSILESFKASKPDGAGLSWSAKSEDHTSETDLSSLLLNLRKLREALLHKSPDDFTKKVHLFSVRVSSAIGHFQTYIPSINYLMNEVRSMLTDAECREIMTLYVLHMSHKNEANNRAWEMFFEHLDPQQDSRLYSILSAWSSGDYNLWMSTYNSESDHAIYCAMTSGLRQMMVHMIDCFTKSFFTYKLEDFMKLLPRGMSWEDFKREYATSWVLKDDVITVRQRRAQ